MIKEKRIYVLCYNEDIESKNLVCAFATRKILNQYLEDRDIKLKENNADIFKFYTIEEIKFWVNT